MKPVTWIGARFRAPFIVEEPEPHHPDLILWLDVAHDRILATDVVEPDAQPEALTTCLRVALAEDPRRGPSVVRVPDSASADLVRPLFSPAVRIEVGPTPELEVLAGRMAREMPGERGPRGYLDQGLPAEGMACLFREAAALYRLAPWRRFDDDEVLGLDIPALGISGACLSIIGALRQNLGVVIFDSLEEFDEFVSRAHRPRRPGDTFDLGAGMLSLNFERGADLPDELRREIAAHRWPVAGADAYPLLFAARADGEVRWLTPRDAQVACVVAAGIVALVTKHSRALKSATDQLLAETVTVETPEPLEFTVHFPHPRMVAEVLQLEGSSEAAREQAMRAATEQIGRFLASPSIAALPQEWRDAAGFLCECLHRGKLEYLDGRWDGFVTRHVDWFLLEHFPRKVSADEELVARTPEVLDRYFEWLGAEGAEPPAAMARARAAVVRQRDKFLAVALDPDRFGPAKSVVMQMHAEGVDFEDEAAVAAFMKRHNDGLAKRPRDSGKRRPRRSGVRRGAAAGAGGEAAATPSPPGGRERAPGRWSAAAGEPAPAPDAPCPCGSGKRYKRCCMLR